jgi:conjugative relaxase-like TrwC/TraI family protein
VLSSAKIGTSSWRYYSNGVACAATEYYLGVGEAPGRWHGRGLAELGLVVGGRVDERQLEALFARGLHPGTGDRLGRVWRADAVTGFDLTFSAPKSVSALWALGDSDAAVAAMGAHRAAVAAGLAYLDTHAGLSRRGTDGVEQVQTHGLAVALFDHRTSRAGDPQLHTHALVSNKVRCADGTWRTLDATELFHHKKSAGMIYQAALRNEMRKRLAVAFSQGSEHGQAEILGVPEKLLSLWSKRAAQIDSDAAPKIAEYEQLLGRALTPAERVNVVKTAVLKTRPGKDHPELSALHAHWTAEAAQAGHSSQPLLASVRAAAASAGIQPPQQEGPVTPDTFAQTLAYTLVEAPETLAQTLAGIPNTVAETLADSLARPAGGDREAPSGTERVLPTVSHIFVPAVVPAVPDPTGEEALAFVAVRAAGQRRAVFSRADVAGQVAAHLPTTGLSALQVVAEVERLTTLAVGLAETVSVGDHPRGVTPRVSDARYASLQVLTAEGRILALAGRGRRRGYGQIPLEDLKPHARTLGLDRGQLTALIALAGKGDFLSVLTAPAGAGKTRTLGAATAAWQQAGYRVVGLAPSARAAAELADATGGKADTLAKWLYTRDRLDQIPAGAPERAWAGLDNRTVLIVDEASMASTLDLDRLVTLAAEKAAKVVLVGDPAQIGVVNGPGGMLAALVHTGHGSTLERIHRFTHDWERQATLALRTGDRAALPVYQAEGRLHACPDADTALEGVFRHWSSAKAEGLDVLMLARTRQDVEALNERARTAAVASGQVHGPAVKAGERPWQAGDLLRTRRNNRQLALGDSHVRNGDRFRVLGPGPATPRAEGGADGAGGQGLIVEDLTGRGRVVLPAEYLAQYCEYGWASTIDGAQGATADVGIVLVRPGIDREHLYVAMTRGRQANHAYVTPDPTVDDDNNHEHEHGGQQRRPGRPSRPEAAVASGVNPPTLEQQTVRVLEAALATSGAQDAAHTALQQARVQAGKDTRDAQTRHNSAAVRERHQARERAEQHLPEYWEAHDRLQRVQTERARLGQEQTERRWSVPHAQAELDQAPRRAIRRRRDLTERITATQEALSRGDRRLEALDDQISDLTGQLQAQERDRENRIKQQRRTPPAPEPADPLGYLEPSPRERTAIQNAHRTQMTGLSRPDVPYRAPQRGGPSRSR